MSTTITKASTQTQHLSLSFPPVIGNVGDSLKIDSVVGDHADLVWVAGSSFGSTSSSSNDLFSRSKVSQAFTIFSSKFRYDKEVFKWETIGAGTFTGPSHGMMTLGCAAGQTIICQSKQYLPHMAGKSMVVVMSGILNKTIPSDAFSRIGMFDDIANKSNSSSQDMSEGNGHFFQCKNISGTIQYSVVQRASVTGTQVDTIYDQTAWNLDTLNSTDFTKTQTFVLEKTGLGVGSVRFGVLQNGSVIWCHQINNNNTLSTTYTSTDSLPLRYELNNISGISAADIIQIASSVTLEGIQSIKEIPCRCRSTRLNGITTTSGSTSDLLAVRVSPNRPRVRIIPTSVSIIMSGGTLGTTTAGFVINAGLLSTSAMNWNSNVSNVGSMQLISSSSNASFTNNFTLASGYMTSSNTTLTFSNIEEYFTEHPLCSTIAGSQSDMMYVSYNQSAQPGTFTWTPIIEWKEIW